MLTGKLTVFPRQFQTRITYRTYTGPWHGDESNSEYYSIRSFCICLIYGQSGYKIDTFFTYSFTLDLVMRHISIIRAWRGVCQNITLSLLCQEFEENIHELDGNSYPSEISCIFGNYSTTKLACVFLLVDYWLVLGLSRLVVYHCSY